MKQWQPLQLPFGYGLGGRTDSRVLNPPELASAKDITFDEFGGLQTRKPYPALGTSVASGSTSFAIGDMRRVVENGDELMLFTKDRLYSRRVASSTWTERGEHLAVKVGGEPRFVTTGDQFDADRAELNGYTVYSWHEYEGVNTYGYIAAIENATGAVICAPFRYPALRIRLIALDTKILFIYYDGISGHYCFALDPADPSAAFSGSATTVHTGGNAFYDACRVPGADKAAIVCRKSPATSYRVVTMTGALVRAEVTKARSADDLAVAVDPTGTYMQVIRRVGVDLRGDLLNVSTLADVYTNQAVYTGAASSPDHLACGYWPSQVSGQYRCQVYWQFTGGPVQTNWVDVGNTLGAAADFKQLLDVCTKPFAHDGHLYIWLGYSNESTFFSNTGLQFGYALQNTYFLYRDDGFLCAKAVPSVAGGPTVYNSLPAVQALADGSYAWAGLSRRVVPIGGATGRSAYSARCPRDVIATFDSDEARRCAKLGQTVYITGGEVLQYDGTQLVEVGFHIIPSTLTLGLTGASGLADGTYAYKQTPRWDNARGDIDRGTSAVVGTVAVTGGPKTVTVDYSSLIPTHKTERPLVIETWRTKVSPNADSPFYLVTSRDPADTSNPNRHLYNDDTAAAGVQLTDSFSDTTLGEQATCLENGDILEPIAPPPATIIAATSERLFLAGVAGDPDRVWYSLKRGDGQVAAFHEQNTISVPREGGAITALAFLNETLVVFRERAIYSFQGDGFDNAGQGQNYGPARIVSVDLGATNAEAIAVEPRGIVFHSNKGKYRLSAGGSCDYIGGAVAEFDGEEVVAVHVVESEHQIRWVTTDRVLVHDYLAVTQQSPIGQWAEWTLTGNRHACMWNGAHVVLNGGGARVQASDYTGIDYGIDITTAWIKLNDLQGAGSVRWLEILGEYRGAHRMRVYLSRDYQTAPYQTVTWSTSPTAVGGPLEVRIGPSVAKCTAIKLRVVALGPSTDTPTSEAFKLSGLGIEVGIDRGLNRWLPATQKAGS